MPVYDWNTAINKKIIVYGREISSADYFRANQISLKEFIQRAKKLTNIADGNLVVHRLLANGENISIQMARKLSQMILAIF